MSTNVRDDVIKKIWSAGNLSDLPQHIGILLQGAENKFYVIFTGGHRRRNIDENLFNVYETNWLRNLLVEHKNRVVLREPKNLSETLASNESPSSSAIGEKIEIDMNQFNSTQLRDILELANWLASKIRVASPRPIISGNDGANRSTMTERGINAEKERTDAASQTSPLPRSDATIQSTRPRPHTSEVATQLTPPRFESVATQYSPQEPEYIVTQCSPPQVENTTTQESPRVITDQHRSEADKGGVDASRERSPSPILRSSGGGPSDFQDNVGPQRHSDCQIEKWFDLDAANNVIPPVDTGDASAPAEVDPVYPRFRGREEPLRAHSTIRPTRHDVLPLHNSPLENWDEDDEFFRAIPDMRPENSYNENGNKEQRVSLNKNTLTKLIQNEINRAINQGNSNSLIRQACLNSALNNSSMQLDILRETNEINRNYKLISSNRFESFEDYLLTELKTKNLIYTLKTDECKSADPLKLERDQNRVREIIINHIDYNYHNRIMCLKDPIEILNKLKEIKRGELKITNHTALKNLYMLKYQPSKEDALSFCDKFDRMVRTYEGSPDSGKIDRKDKRSIFFNAISDSVPQVLTAECVNKSTLGTSMSIEQLKSFLLQTEQRKSQGEKPNAMLSYTRKTPIDHSKRKLRECFECHKMTTHIARKCRAMKQKQ